MRYTTSSGVPELCSNGGGSRRQTIVGADRSGEFTNYVNDCTVKTLCLSTHKSSLKVSMAVDSLQGSFRHCCVELTLQGVVYKNVYLGVMKDLCCDILLGQDFQRQNRRVIFEYDGTRPELVVSSLPPQTCAVAAAKPECPPCRSASPMVSLHSRGQWMQ